MQAPAGIENSCPQYSTGGAEMQRRHFRGHPKKERRGAVLRPASNVLMREGCGLSGR